MVHTSIKNISFHFFLFIYKALLNIFLPSTGILFCRPFRINCSFYWQCFSFSLFSSYFGSPSRLVEALVRSFKSILEPFLVIELSPLISPSAYFLLRLLVKFWGEGLTEPYLTLSWHSMQAWFLVWTILSCALLFDLLKPWWEAIELLVELIFEFCLLFKIAWFFILCV